MALLFNDIAINKNQHVSNVDDTVQKENSVHIAESAMLFNAIANENNQHILNIDDNTAKKKVACKRQKLITAKIPTSLITDKIPTIFTNFGPYYRLSVISYY